MFVNKHPNLKVRIVHGNTLTAAVILKEIPANVGEVFLTGATSKLGRAIALYLCRKKVRVMVSYQSSRRQEINSKKYIENRSTVLIFFSQMLTLSTERFLKIQREAPLECQQYLVQVTKYQAAQNCKVCTSVLLQCNEMKG